MVDGHVISESIQSLLCVHGCSTLLHIGKKMVAQFSGARHPSTNCCSMCWFLPSSGSTPHAIHPASISLLFCCCQNHKKLEPMVFFFLSCSLFVEKACFFVLFCFVLFGLIWFCCGPVANTTETNTTQKKKKKKKKR
jgi:hypothetical protein